MTAEKHNGSVFLVAILVWIVFLAIAFGFGAIRELMLTPAIGESASHVIGTLAVVVAFLGVIFLFVRRYESLPSGTFWFVGVAWLAATIAFEFLFFHFASGKSWSDLLADYNVLRGRIWILVPLTTLLGPPLLHQVFELKQR